jgi:hypothetical protein
MVNFSSDILFWQKMLKKILLRAIKKSSLFRALCIFSQVVVNRELSGLQHGKLVGNKKL